MPWIWLAGAIVLEILATTCLKLSDGLTRLWPSLIMAVSYLACFGCLAQALRQLEVSVAYAVWSGAGTAIVALIGVLVFQESLTLLKGASLALIVLGVVGLHLSSAKLPL